MEGFWSIIWVVQDDYPIFSLHIGKQIRVNRVMYASLHNFIRKHHNNPNIYTREKLRNREVLIK